MVDSGRTLRVGLTVGLIGYAAVALFYVVFDFLAARGFLFTLNLLGQVVVRGVRDAAVLQLPMAWDTGAMIAYNFAHLGVALAVGLFVTALVARTESRKSSTLPVWAVLVSGYILTIAAVGAVALDLPRLLPFWTIAFANTLAAILAATYLLKAFPTFLRSPRGPVAARPS